MSWDFSTEPEFAAKLDWVREFVRDEIYPLEVLDLDHAEFRRLAAPLQQRVKEQGLWAAHLGPELGGQGYGQLRLGLLHEILGTSELAPFAFGCQAPDSGNIELPALAGSATATRIMTPPVSAITGISIFIDSRMASSSSACTVARPVSRCYPAAPG